MRLAAVALLSSVLLAVPQVAATETGLESLHAHAPRVNRHQAIAKSRKARKARRGTEGKSGVCAKRNGASSSSSSSSSSSTPAPESKSTKKVDEDKKDDAKKDEDKKTDDKKAEDKKDENQKDEKPKDEPKQDEKPKDEPKQDEKPKDEPKKPEPSPEPKPESKPKPDPKPAVSLTVSGAKCGLAWNDANNADVGMFTKSGKVGWYYTWSPWSIKAPGLEHVPMYWGPKQAREWEQNFDPAKHKWMLGFNEPDHGDQAGMSPEDAADYWKKNIAHLPVAKVSPAPTGSPKGLNWLDDFFKACGGQCDISAVAIHFYGTKSGDFIKFAQEAHNRFGMDLWVTEIACQNFGGGAQCSDDDTFKFMQEVVGWMESTSYVKRYSWFGSLKNMFNVNENNRLMDASGHSLTPLGKALVG